MNAIEGAWVVKCLLAYLRYIKASKDGGGYPLITVRDSLAMPQ